VASKARVSAATRSLNFGSRTSAEACPVLPTEDRMGFRVADNSGVNDHKTISQD